MTYTVGIDIGSGVVKTVLFESSGEKTTWLAKRLERMRGRAISTAALKASANYLAAAENLARIRAS